MRLGGFVGLAFQPMKEKTIRLRGPSSTGSAVRSGTDVSTAARRPRCPHPDDVSGYGFWGVADEAEHLYNKSVWVNLG